MPSSFATKSHQGWLKRGKRKERQQAHLLHIQVIDIYNRETNILEVLLWQLKARH